LSWFCSHYPKTFRNSLWTITWTNWIVHCQNCLICLGHVCFPENSFRETTFQTFLCLFTIKKVGQRKTLSGQRKTLSRKKKIGLVSRKVFFLLAVFVFRKVVSGKSLSKLSCVCLPLEKLVNGKHFPVKGKFGLVFRKVFSWKIWAENTFQKLWKI